MYYKTRGSKIITKSESLSNLKKDLTGLSIKNIGTTVVEFEGLEFQPATPNKEGDSATLFYSETVPFVDQDNLFTFKDDSDAGNKVYLSFTRIHFKEQSNSLTKGCK